MFYRKYIFGETALYYAEVPIEGHEGKTTIGFAAYPANLVIDAAKLPLDSLVQAAFTNDEGLIDYTFGLTMRNRESTVLKIEEQIADEKGVFTRLSDGSGNVFYHTLRYFEKTDVFSVQVAYENKTESIRTLEMLESISLSGICAPSCKDLSTRGLTLHRMTSAWSRECRLKSESFSSLGLDMSWARYGVKCEKWGQVGSMSNRNYYPFAAIEDKESGIIWGVTLEAPYSWQLEVYKEKETCSLSGGLSDYEFGHWRKEIMPKERFHTHEAFFTVKTGGGVNGVCNAFVREADSRLTVPESEDSMPVLFNEYCTTWGVPSEENIHKILTALKPFPIDIFVIDAGWYKPDNKDWCNAIGDWRVSNKLFPSGIGHIAKTIKSCGMKPGIWFEFEVAGRDSDLFHREELLLKRDGTVITSKNRRFLDLRTENTDEYLNHCFLSLLQNNGFEYLKIDYNDTYGMGCDSEDGGALGEGGRQIAEASLEWLDKIKDAVPGIVIENCSSGGSRIEPLRMSKVAMCSFSDAHECAEIPLVAANVSRVIPARQIQIWAVLRENDTISRTIYSLCAAMLGRICFSGDVFGLSPEKSACILDGLQFYNAIKDIVRGGDISLIDCDVEYYREPFGRQIYVKTLGNRRLVVVHCLDYRGEISLPLEGFTVAKAYTDLPYTAVDALKIEGKPFCAGAFLLIKEQE